ncbi:MAG TPA: acyltransferase [Usitatibacteraceae bacterium]|nr:acyltransferase [Usitatibacteraceae bacterium]
MREPAATRSYFIDRLRVGLTMLVIAHHTAITYGAMGGWFYREAVPQGSLSSLLLSLFCAVNQAFFMGMFFLIAGYYTPASFARKGTQRFLVDRLIRLGIPLLVFGYFLGPMTVAIAGMPAGKEFFETWGRLAQQFRFVGGPLWFAQALLLFAAAYAIWTLGFRRAGDSAPGKVPAARWWLAAALGVGLASLLLRQWVPVGKEWWGLQVGYFASYIFLFALGCVAARPGWLERITRAEAAPWMVVSLLAIPMLPVAMKSVENPASFLTGWTLAAAAYAFWEPFVAWGIIAGLLWLVREHGNQPHPLWQALGERAYGAYIVHPPVIVGIAVALHGWQAPPFVMFLTVAACGIAGSFALAGLLLGLPGARRVL